MLNADVMIRPKGRHRFD